MQSRIYLAAPYSHPEYRIRARRYLYATQAANVLTQGGYIVYSPVTHGHTIGLFGGLRGDFEFWRGHCLSFLQNWAEELWVYTLDGWETSVGVSAEIEEARRVGLPVGYMLQGAIPAMREDIAKRTKQWTQNGSA